MNHSDTSENTIAMGDAGDRATRRAFLGAAGLAGTAYAAAIGYPVYRYLASPIEQAAANAAVTQVTLKDAQKLAAGTALMFKFGPSPAMLIHHTDGTWVALGAVCSHLGCTVQYLAAQNRIHCFCHGGEYDPNTGENISGPPPKPLRRFAVTVAADGVTISRIPGGRA
jgi:cytochrome b6-f complex iron-sulfur subunit